MIEIQKEWAQFRFGAWPEDLDCDGALNETAGALDNVVSTWIDLRQRCRETMTDLTMTPFRSGQDRREVCRVAAPDRALPSR